MPLDIRQESDRHSEALDCITRHLGLGSYALWDEGSRSNLIKQQLQSKWPLLAWRNEDCSSATQRGRELYMKIRAMEHAGLESQQAGGEESTLGASALLSPRTTTGWASPAFRTTARPTWAI